MRAGRDSGRRDPKPRGLTQLTVPVVAAVASIAVAVVWIALTGHPANPVSAPQAPGTSYPTQSTQSTPSTTTAPHAEGDAAEVLSTLAVKGRAARTGYDRASFRFGADVDNDGCDTRDDVLARDLIDRTVLADDQ